MANIEHITYQDKDIYLIKTAHVSKESVREVHEAIEELQPDVICVELDKGRYESLLNPEAYKQMDIIKIIKEKRTAMVLVNLVLSSYQKRMAKKLEVNSGDEMRAAIEEAKERNLKLVLADRNIQTTFTRVWRAHTFWDKIKLIGGIIGACFDDEDLTEEDLEQLKQTDMLTAALNDISKEFPRFAESLIFERDKYLTAKIREANGKKIVAVIGAAHSIGIKEHINDEISIEELDRIPPKTFLSKISGWIIPAIIIGLILSSFQVDASLGFEQIKSWLLWNGGLSALGTLLVMGHPLSILTAFVAAPFTSLNPLIAAGWFAGLVEAYMRKPRVIDLENLSDDMNSLKGIMNNRFIRILLVVVMANLFSSIATYVSGADIIKNLLSNI
ncbi:MAG: TraB/GumN family protein [Erysipelotrichales bacterium]|nr:TraB/GumN family protein [Erysipelotrichales bacterium]